MSTEQKEYDGGKNPILFSPVYFDVNWAPCGCKQKFVNGNVAFEWSI